VYSIEKVGDELLAGSDELATWAGNRGAGFFLPPDAKTITSLTQVAEWTRRQNYRPGAVNAFL